MNDYTIVQALQGSSGALGPAPLIVTLKNEEKNADRHLAHFYVAKLIPQSFFGSQLENMDNLKNDLERLQNLNHPGIVKYFNNFLERNFFHIIYDYSSDGKFPHFKLQNLQKIIFSSFQTIF